MKAFKELKVLHFYKAYAEDNFIAGGIEKVINQLARSTGHYGINNQVLTLSHGGAEKKSNIDGHLVHRCRTIFETSSTPFSASALLRFRQLMREVDLVHYHFPYPFADLLHFCSGVTIPTLVTYHSDIVKQKYLYKLYRPLQDAFLGSVDRIVATSPNYKSTSRILAAFQDKTCVIPLGLDKATYPVPSNSKLDYWKGRFGARFFLFVGVFRYYKGLHILIEAAANRHYPIIIVGTGRIEKELKAKVSELNINNLHFVGALPDEDKTALLSLCHSVLFPSHLRSEAFGISLLEGAMYGKPLISSEIGTGTTYININKETGLVVPADNPAALRDAMDFMWNNEDKAAQMGRNALHRYETLFTAEKMAASYVQLYRALLFPNVEK